MAKQVKETRYAFKRHHDGESYQAIKMTKEGAVQETYKINKTNTQCSCPAHVYCRHQKMLTEFKGANHLGDGWTLIYETGEWLPPEKIDKPGGLYEGLFDDGDDNETQPAHLIDI